MEAHEAKKIAEAARLRMASAQLQTVLNKVKLAAENGKMQFEFIGELSAEQIRLLHRFGYSVRQVESIKGEMQWLIAW